MRWSGVHSEHRPLKFSLSNPGTVSTCHQPDDWSAASIINRMRRRFPGTTRAISDGREIERAVERENDEKYLSRARLIKAKSLNTGNQGKFIHFFLPGWENEMGDGSTVITETSGSATGTHAVILANLGRRLRGAYHFNPFSFMLMLWQRLWHNDAWCGGWREEGGRICPHISPKSFCPLDALECSYVCSGQVV